MSLLDITFIIPSHIAKDLADGRLERVGGVVRDIKTKEVVMWLKETSSTFSPHLMPLLQLGSAASILNLGVSVIGFAVVMGRLKELENNLKQELTKINDKIDLGFYASFCTALSLASNIHTMEHTESRRVMAYQAIPRFLDAQHIFYDYASKSMQQGSSVTDEYLLILFLAYIAEARCHLEIEELGTAIHRFQEGTSKIYPLICMYIKWVDSLPTGIIQKQTVPGTWFADGMLQFLTGVFGNREAVQQTAVTKQEVTSVESMIETYRRFETYQTEVKAIAQLGISFHDWLQLTPKEAQPEGSSLMYIIPAEPLAL